MLAVVRACRPYGSTVELCPLLSWVVNPVDLCTLVFPADSPVRPEQIATSFALRTPLSVLRCREPMGSHVLR